MRETGRWLSGRSRISFAVALCVLAWVTTFAAAAAADPSWKIVDLPIRDANLHSISCPSASLCVGVGSPAVFATSNAPAGDASAWQVSSFAPVDRLDGELLGVDCPSVSLCVAVEYDGTILTTTTPTAGAAAWSSQVQVPGAERLRGVSCPRTTLCVAVGEGGEVVSSTAPTAGAGAWELVELETPLRGVSCVSALCFAVGPQAILSSTEPRGGAGSWRIEPQDPLDPRSSSLTSIDCPADSFCLAGDADGVRATSNPAGSFSDWRPTSLSSGFQVHGTGCTTAGHCVATTDDGAAFASTDPLGGPSAWIAAHFEGRAADGLFTVSCPSETLCVAGGGFGEIASSTNPFEAPTPARAVPLARPKRPRTVLLGKHHRRLRLKRGRRTIGVRFQFTANGDFNGFRCRLDRRRPRACRSPKAYQLDRGKHVFSVRAVGPGGADRTPGATRVEILRRARPRPGR